MRLLVFRARTQAGSAVGLVLLFLAFLVVAIDGQALSPLFPLLGRRFGVDPGRAVLVTGSFQVAMLLSPLLIRVHRGRAKRLLLAGMAVFVAGCRLAGAARSFGPFLGARFVVGLASALFLPALGAYVGERFPYAVRGRAMAFVRSAWSLAGVAGIPLAARVAERAGIATLFGGLSIAGVASLVLLAVFLPSTPGPPQLPVSARPSPAHLVVMAIALMWIMGPCSVFFFLAAHLESHFGLATTAIGSAFSLCAVAGLAGNLASGWAADRWGKRKVTVLSLTLMGVVLAGLPMAATASKAILLAAAMTMALEWGWSAFQAIASEVDPGARAATLAAANMGYGLGNIVVASLAPWLWRAGGFGVALTFGLGAALGALVLTVGLLPPVSEDSTAS
ncbi:MAG: MFS transporter [bacterium]|nr:MFS transporter [bacterium]